MRITKRDICIIVIVLLFLVLTLQIRNLELPLIPRIISFIEDLTKYIEKNSNFLQGTAVITGLLIFIYRRLRKSISPASLKDKDNFLQPITINELRDSLGQWGGQVEWIDRGTITIDNLRRNKRIALMGTRKIGKTREAIELISRAVDSDLVLRSSIFIPDMSINLQNTSNMYHKLKEKFYGKSSALLFIDDLPHYFNGEMLDDLGEMLEIAEDLCPNLFLVFTIRTDQWKDSHRIWIQKHKIAQYRVKPLNRNQTEILLKNALKTFQIEADSEAIEVFVANSDGTPEHALSSLRQLHVSGIERINVQIAMSQAFRETTIIWHDTRYLIEKEQPLAREIIRVLSIFHSSGLKPYIHIVQAIAAFAWIQEHGFLGILSIKRQLRSALTYLKNFDIVTGSRIIIAPDTALQQMNILQVQMGLAKWLIKQDSVWRKLTLRYFFNALEEYYATLLAIEKAGQDHPDYDRVLHMRLKARKDAFLNKIASEIEKALQSAIQNFPYDEGHYENIHIVFNKSQSLLLDSTGSWCFEGFESMRRDDKSYALEAFRTAIDKSPDNYLAHFGIGILYWSWNQTQEAINECKQVIQINPKFVYGYYLLGHIYSALQESDAAIGFFEKSIELNPDFVPSMLGLANIWLLREESDKALSFLEAEYGRLPMNKNIDMLITWIKILMNDNSIEQNGEKITELLFAYLPEATEGVIRTEIVDLEIALRDTKIIMASFLKENIEDIYAVELTDVFILIAELNILENRLDKAISVLKKTVLFSPNLTKAYITLGHTYHLADLTSTAVNIYEQAVSLNPKNIDPYIGLARIYLSTDKIDEAVKISFKSLEIDPYSIESHIMLAVCYQRLGYEDKYIEQIDAVINQEDLDSFSRARIEILSGNDENALSLIEYSFNKGLVDLSDLQIDPCITKIKDNPVLRGIIEKHRYDFDRMKL